MVDRQLFTNKLNEIRERAFQRARSEMKMFTEDQLSKVSPEEYEEVLEFFKESLVRGAEDGCDEAIEGILFETMNESNNERKVSIRESVEIISGKQKMNENLESSMCQAAKEGFCILMDWDIKPEDIVKCIIVDDVDGIFSITTADGENFKYNMKDDCLL